jgi:hypothetical protein
MFKTRREGGFFFAPHFLQARAAHHFLERFFKID